ncbi:DUF2069 domain-containing protein [Veronia pacifica]|uniref:DUF2069 domain-containing protein n=1 Tax=Veronia pacifica TaxID=1080227 RepID=A0A1C3EEQ2_9GAMM|nr:DUF2069 domain-containing protein [Veronia pacifica]ODA31674.1 hypothetical protein A8L45_15630 [Veronia pacifica]
MTVRQLRFIALGAHLAMIALVALWHSVIFPHPDINPTGMTVAWLLPLLLPLVGILKGKPYTHAWANFILMFYFLHALTMIWVDEGKQLMAVFELVLTSISFIANVRFAKLRGRELGQGLKKLSQVEKDEKAFFESSN